MINLDGSEVVDRHAAQAVGEPDGRPAGDRATCAGEGCYCETGPVIGGRTGLPARLAFAAIRSGRRVGPAEIARHADLQPDLVAAELRQLAESGEANLDEAGQVVAVAGLSLVPARHELELAGQPLHTWCAWDAIGIPAALELDARLRTHCHWCQSHIVVELSKGRIVGEPSALLWFPTRPVDGNWRGNPQVVWCPQANLFCDREQLKRWQAAAATRAAKRSQLGRRRVGARTIGRPFVSPVV